MTEARYIPIIIRTGEEKQYVDRNFLLDPEMTFRDFLEDIARLRVYQPTLKPYEPFYVRGRLKKKDIKFCDEFSIVPLNNSIGLRIGNRWKHFSPSQKIGTMSFFAELRKLEISSTYR